MSNAEPRKTTDRCIECDGELLLFAESPCGWCQQCGTIATSVKTGTGYQAKYFIPKQVATLTAEVARLKGLLKKWYDERGDHYDIVSCCLHLETAEALGEDAEA